MNLNIMLLLFVIIGVNIFKGTYEAEQTGTANSSILNTLTDFLLKPNINATVVNDCSGFTGCTEAFFSVAIDVVSSLLFILADIVIFAFIIITVFFLPIPDAPMMIQLLFYTLELGGVYVVIGMFRGGE